MAFDPLVEFARLVENFPRLCHAAELLEDLAAAHDAAVVRLAIIGYSFHCNTGTWTDRDSSLVKECRANMPVNAFSPAWISFACLATGYMIGVRRTGAASDLEALHAESLLPGFMIRHRGRIEGLYMATQIKPQLTLYAPASSSAKRTAATRRPAG